MLNRYDEPSTAGAYKPRTPSAPAAEGTLNNRVDQFRDANALLSDMANQAEALLIRVAGSRPEKNATVDQKLNSVPNGLIDEFQVQIDDYRALTTRLGEALNRLQNSI